MTLRLVRSYRDIRGGTQYLYRRPEQPDGVRREVQVERPLCIDCGSEYHATGAGTCVESNR